MKREIIQIVYEIKQNSNSCSYLFICCIFSGQYVLGYGGLPEQSSANNYTIKINYDMESYNLGDSITFSGFVNKYDKKGIYEFQFLT